ncbi:MAG: ornithine carbamoyltransferase [Bacteroidota bacterium]
MKRDLTSFSLWTREQLSDIFSLARRLKRGDMQDVRSLIHKSAALIFEKESLRTRVSFEVGVAQLGGHPIFLQQETIGLATRESVHDIASVLSRYNELIIARTTRHQTLIQLAESATVPVINAMTDLVHPCQILADAFTLQELNRFTASTRIVFIGEGNNIVNSWLELAEKFPLNFVAAVPPGHEPHPLILDQARGAGISRIEIIHDPIEAVQAADVVYTDVWSAPAAEGDAATHQLAFKPYQVNAALMKHTKPDSIVMHRLPAKRGEEITREVIDGKNSVVLHQAENRLHVQKGVMAYLLNPPA